MVSARSKVCLGTFTCICSILFLIGFVGYLFFPSILKGKVEEQMQLVDGSETFEKWTTVPVPIYMSFRLFNITNPEDFMNGSRAEVQEVGPYVYREYRRKEVQGFNKHQNTVNYLDRKTFVFQPSMSSGSESDMVNMLNAPLVAIAEMTSKHLPESAAPLMMPILESMMNKYNETLVIQRSVGQMLFDGYQVNVMKDLMKLAKAFLPDLENPMKNNTFGLFYGKNSSTDGLYSVFTGEGDSSKFAVLNQWNNQKKLTYWGSEQCNMINGTDGGQFPPFRTRKDTLYVFATDLCRSIFTYYEKDIDVKGIPAYRFVTPDTLMAAADEVEYNRCFCYSPTNCLKSGALPLASCQRGAPVVLSAPHFYMGDDAYITGVGGLHPMKEKHETYIDVEPTTGLVLRAAKRLQVNVHLKRNEKFEPLSTIQENIHPLVWVEEKAEVDDKFVGVFTQKLLMPQQIGYGTLITAMILGGVGSAICAVLIVMFYLQGKSKTAGISTEQLNAQKKGWK